MVYLIGCHIERNALGMTDSDRGSVTKKELVKETKQLCFGEVKNGGQIWRQSSGFY